MNGSPWSEDQKMRQRVSDALLPVLGVENFFGVLDIRNLHISKQCIVEHSDKRSLSDAILEHAFPHVRGQVELDHYTTMPRFRGIVQSGDFRLSQLRKRLGEHEFWSFAEDHGLRGYLEQNDAGKALYKDLADDLFFGSFTRPGTDNEDGLWEEFGGHGRGVRLRLRLEPLIADAELRPIHYPHGPTLLKRVNDALIASVGVPFIPRALSRVGAFYLPLTTYGWEQEVRLLVKRWKGGKNLRCQLGNTNIGQSRLVARTNTAQSISSTLRPDLKQIFRLSTPRWRGHHFSACRSFRFSHPGAHTGGADFAEARTLDDG